MVEKKKYLSLEQKIKKTVPEEATTPPQGREKKN
jgi:hypothetical protein